MSESRIPHDGERNGAPSAREQRVFLVLGGGGVRGLAHLGVLKVLDEASVPIHAIVGTSAGAMVGGMYATDPDGARLADETPEFLQSSAFRRLNLRFEFDSRSAGKDGQPGLLDRLLHGIRRQLAMELLFRRPAIFTTKILAMLVKNLVPKVAIEETKIPLHVTALDLIGGQERILSKGDLREAIIASSSLPGFFPPVEVDGTLMCDAGLVNNMPVDEARQLGADVVIAVSLNSEVDAISEFSTGIEVIFRGEEIGSKLINDRKKARADVVIEPEMHGRYWLDFRDPASVVAAGEAAARAELPRILAAIGRPAETRA